MGGDGAECAGVVRAKHHYPSKRDERFVASRLHGSAARGRHRDQPRSDSRRTSTSWSHVSTIVVDGQRESDSDFQVRCTHAHSLSAGSRYMTSLRSLRTATAVMPDRRAHGPRRPRARVQPRARRPHRTLGHPSRPESTERGRIRQRSHRDARTCPTGPSGSAALRASGDARYCRAHRRGGSQRPCCGDVGAVVCHS